MSSTTRVVPRKPVIPARRTQAFSGPSSARSSPAPSGSGVRRPGAPGGRVGTNARGTEDGYLYVAGVKDPSKRVTEYRRDDDVCPICHTDRQFNRNLRLLVSPCYHKMCESCIDRLFTLGPEPCPTLGCGKILRKVNFAHQTFEDLKVEKEVAVRRRMAENFNKRRDDFASDREYDDYLEEVEDLTFNLLNDIDIARTEARITEFTRNNASLIAANQQKAALEALSQVERDEVEKVAREERMRMVEEAERVEREEETRIKAEIVEALATGSQAEVEEITDRARRAREARAAALAAAIPPSLAKLYDSLKSRDGANDEDMHAPTSPSYEGPYVPIPYNDPEKSEWSKWYEVKDDGYVDGRSEVIFAREDGEGKVRGGGWDLKLFWEMEVRSAVEGLAIV